MTGVEADKNCNRCGTTKPPEAFAVRKQSPTGQRYAICRQCVSEKNKAKHKKNKGKYLQDKYGITLAEFQELLNQQNGVCAICKGTSRDGSALHTDHCHKSNRVRGLLCYKCNVAVGFLDDDANRADALASYLRQKGSDGLSPS